MTDPTTVLPDFGAPTGSTLRVQATSRLAFGATTAALVTLASGGTAVLVAHGTSSLSSSPTALPQGSLLTDAASAGAAVVVDRAPGTLGVVTHPAVAPPANLDATERALTHALAKRPKPGKRTLTVPLVRLPVKVPVVTLPVVKVPVVKVPAVVVPPVVVPVVVPPVVTPVVVTPPVHVPHVPSTPPVVVTPPPVVTPPVVVSPVVVTPPVSVPTTPPVSDPTDGGDEGSSDGNHHRHHHRHGGHHHGSAADVGSKVIDLRDPATAPPRGKHARSGRHSR